MVQVILIHFQHCYVSWPSAGNFKDYNRINGLTTATTIWVCAALGMSVGAGYIFLAFVGATAVLCVLSLLVFAEHYIDTRSTTRDYRIVCAYTDNTLREYEKIFI